MREAGTRTIRASNNGVVDLSSLQSMSGGIGNDEVEFLVSSGGNILLSSLTTTAEAVRFNVDVPDYTVPVLTRSSEPIFDLESNAAHFPALESVEYASFAIDVGGLFDAPLLHRFVKSSIDLFPGVGFQTAVLDSIDGSRFTVSGGLSAPPMAITDTDYIYENDALLPVTTDVFAVDGVGSSLDLTSLLTYTDLKNVAGAGTRTIHVSNNGVIDLSSLQSMNGGIGNDEVEFLVSSGGNILLSSLTTTAEAVRFNVDVPDYTVPVLTRSSEPVFDLEANTAHFPALESVEYASFAIDVGGVFDAPLLHRFVKSSIDLFPGVGFQTAVLDSVDGSRFTVSGGLSAPPMAITDTDYTYENDALLPVTTDVFAVDGVGSSLDLTSLLTYTDLKNVAGAGTRTIRVSNNGVVDLSSLQSMNGGIGNDEVEFLVSSGGNILLSSLTTTAEAVRFNVDVPDYTVPVLTRSSEPVFDLEANTAHFPALESVEYASFAIDVGGLFDAPLLHRFVKSSIDLFPGVGFQTAVLDSVDGSRFTVSGGLSAPPMAITDTDYIYENDALLPVTTDVFAVDGVGSSLDLTSLLTYTDLKNVAGAGTRTIRVSNNGVVDLSSLQSMNGGIGNDEVEFLVSSGGNILLSSLTTTAEAVRFNVDVPDYTVPVLTRSSEPVFDLEANTAHFPALESVEYASFAIDVGGLFDAPLLHRFVKSSIDLFPGVGFQTAVLDSVDGSRFTVSGGLSAPPMAITDTDYIYENDALLPVTTDVFAVDGVGSSLDLTSLLTYTDLKNVAGAGTRTIRVSNNGVVDLSSLQSMNGGIGNDEVEFLVSSGGNILLSSLTTTAEAVRFNVDVPDYTVPVLTRSSEPVFDLEANTAHFPALESVEYASFAIDVGGVFDAPLLHRFVKSSIDLSPGIGFQTATLDSIDGSRFTVSGGVPAPVITDTDYYYDDHTAFSLTADVFVVDGSGSALDLSTLTRYVDSISTSGSGTRTIRASVSGSIDLSGVYELSGPPGNDRLDIGVETAGTIDLSAVGAHSGNIDFSASGPGSELRIGSLDLVEGENSISVSAEADLIVKKGLVWDHDPESEVDLTNGRITFDTVTDVSCSQVLELASEDLGTGGPTTGNFGIGRLVIGSGSGPGVVQLVDWHDNGNRQGGLEALYLFGLAGEDGLRLFPGSTLIIPVDVKVYASIAGVMTDLSALLTGPTVPFDEGFLQLGLPTTNAPDSMVPVRLALHPIQPNPSVRGSRLRFDVPDRTPVDLSIFDVSGRRIATLVKGAQEPGNHAVAWQGVGAMGRPVPAGIYFVRLSTVEKVLTRRMVIVR